eukprot:5565178-Prymnesium_polylepis.1
MAHLNLGGEPRGDAGVGSHVLGHPARRAAGPPLLQPALILLPRAWRPVDDVPRGGVPKDGVGAAAHVARAARAARRDAVPAAARDRGRLGLRRARPVRVEVCQRRHAPARR